LAVSLFPFLAVLICTLGVLIVLLVLAVKSADMDATNRQAAADDQQQQQLKAIEHDLEAREIQIDGLQMVRPEALERLSNARRTRSHFEAEIRRLQVEAEQMAIEVQQLQQQRAGLTLEDVTDEQLESLREQIKSAKVDRELARPSNLVNRALQRCQRNQSSSDLPRMHGRSNRNPAVGHRHAGQPI
jgi:septal ring factor EnvC (AmiA/AmiB activator)